jgi:hypothetical protein
VNWKRWTVCSLRFHKWNKVPYPGDEDQGFFLRCARCGHENHNRGGPGLKGGGPFMTAGG